MALDNMGPLAAPAVPALIRALRDPDAKVRPWAARALGSIGPAAEAAVPALQKAGRLDGAQGPAEEAIRKIPYAVGLVQVRGRASRYHRSPCAEFGARGLAGVPGDWPFRLPEASLFGRTTTWDKYERRPCGWSRR